MSQEEQKNWVILNAAIFKIGNDVLRGIFKKRWRDHHRGDWTDTEAGIIMWRAF